MTDLIWIYILLPLTYSAYKAGELARDKGASPIKWKISAFLITFTTGLIASALTGLAIILFHRDPDIKIVAAWWSVITFLLGCLGSGFALLSRLKRKREQPKPKRQFREYDFKNALLFPRIIPRGGFFWRLIAYTLLLTGAQLLITLPFVSAQESLASLSWPMLILLIIVILYLMAGISCSALLYFISYICLPRIRDAGLSNDTVVLLFIPGLNTVVTFMLLFTPTKHSGRV